MTRAVDAIVTGFVKSPAVLEASLAPLRHLKQESVLRKIVCVTWGSPEIDAYVAPLEAMSDVELVRVRQPDVAGTGNQRGIVYQVRCLDVGLSQIAEDDALVLKLRPDFVANVDFLRGKIAHFDRLSEVPSASALGVAMPAPVLTRKIWLPWADSNQPFYCEDAAFMGLKSDIARLVTPILPEDLAILAHRGRGPYAHVMRYGKIFLPHYPIFANYLGNYADFDNDVDFRMRFVRQLLIDPFFLHLLIAHAWILYSQFHVDAGAQGDLAFYANAANRHADWSKPETLKTTMPYDDVEAWRDRTKPGLAMASLRRVYGRVLDDDWQTELFTDEVPDLPGETLTKLLENVVQSGDGRLAGIERQFYAKLSALHRVDARPVRRTIESTLEAAA